MCGIIGIASVKPINDNWYEIGRDSMKHRGPDDYGSWLSNDKRVWLGHRRLSIIDLSPLAHQPMQDNNNEINIIYNGEIYNFNEIRKKLINCGYNFFSNSDTEVIINAYAKWGVDCLNYIDGMFAFAIFDTKNQKLFIARDRSGQKPLFYNFSKGKFQFASELKALLKNPKSLRKIDINSLDCYLAMGFVPGKRSILQNYNKLEPGHWACFDLQNGKLKISRYWSLPPFSGNLKISDSKNYLIEELENLLENSVNNHLIADVPVGILLSGGLDSSIITAIAARKIKNLNTFSIRFPGYDKFDETNHARLIANYFITEHTELTADANSIQLIPELSAQFDEPIADSSMIPTFLVSKLVRQYCKVALGGDGGDELFGGYNHYSRLLWLKKNLDWLPSRIKIIFTILAKTMPLGFANRNLKTWLLAASKDLKYTLPPVANIFDNDVRIQLMSDFRDYKPVSEDIHKKFVPNNTDLLQRATRSDFTQYLAEDLLVKIDRASMLNSLELRSPFLDKRLIEFAFSEVPTDLKATHNDRKILLKEVAKKLLPTEFDLNRKQGFSIPLNKWLEKGPFRELFWDTLNSFDCMFNKKTINLLLRRQDQGFNHGERLFSLVMFELWRKKYGAYL